MEFKCLTNIETSFRQLRMYAFVFVGICAVVTVAAVWLSYSFAERQRQMCIRDRCWTTDAR